MQLNRFCASGLESVNIAAQKVASGWEDLILAGGVESMSRVPMGTDGGAWAMDPETNFDISFVPQGISADLIATIEGFSRDDVDAYGARSQDRAATAQAEGRFAKSVVPVRDMNDHVVLDNDEFIRPGTTVETLGKLKPAFKAIGEMGGFDAVALQKYHWVETINHVHTPGNSSGIVDGASLLLIGNAEIGEQLGLTPRARILGHRRLRRGADDHAHRARALGPKALAKAGLDADDLDLVEINEAFAAVVLRFVRDMDLDLEKVNVNGGAIAMGHPLGATGAWSSRTLIDELERQDKRTGWRRCASAAAWASRPWWRGSDERLDNPLGARQGRRRHPDAGRPEPVGQHHERRLQGVDGGGRRPALGRARRDHGRRAHVGQEDVLRRRQPERPQAHAQGGRRGGGGEHSHDQVPAAPARDARQAGRRRDQRRGARRRPGDRARHATSGSRSTAPSVQLGFPEVQLGLLPGRRRRDPHGADVGHRGRADAAAAPGHALPAAAGARARDRGRAGRQRDELVPAAKAWIAANPEAVQRWDVKGYKIPGGTPSTPKFAANLPAFPANLRKQTKGANYPAPHHIMAAAVEGSQVDFDNALEIEGRYFVDLATGQVAKNMIQAFFFDMQAVSGKRGRPESVETVPVKKVVILGAGMMGAAIGYVCAKVGIEVVLKDVNLEAAEKGKNYSVKLVEKGVSRGKTTAEKGAALLARITPSASPEDADGAELVIEAVFEDPAVKAKVFAEIEPHLAPDALLGSNTSTLPITQLAEGVSRPTDFIGLHFFSPVDKMPLLEIVKGERTSDTTLYRALDLAKQIGKTPIVVNDSRGFFTSRVIGTFINEGMAMLAEGVPPLVDRAGVLPGGLSRPRAPALRRAQPQPPAPDPSHGPRGRRGRGHRVDRAPRRRRRRSDDRRVQAPRQARGRGLLRVR